VKRCLRLCFGALAALLLVACASPPATQASTEADSRAMREDSDRLIVVAVANPKAAIAVQAGSAQVGYTATQRYAAGSDARAALAALKKEHGLRELAAWPIAALRLHCVVLEVAPGASRDAVIAALAKDARVEIAQPLQTFSALTTKDADYNDPYVELQHGFVEVQAAQAHRVSQGKGASVAIIDTGVDTTHPDLQGRIATVRNFVDRDDAQFHRDRHGTEVAGVIAAVANNRQGIVGVAPEAKLAVYKACWQTKPNDGARCNSFTLAQALAASIEEGSRIINLSLGGPSDELLGRLVAHAIGQGSIVVGAMPVDGNPSGFPAGIPGVIMVDAAGRKHARRDVLRAPGRDILTLEPGGSYDFNSGSSLAAAHVSATAALLLSAAPKLNGAAVRSLLESSQTQTGADESISACIAVAGLRKAASCTSRFAPAPGRDVRETHSSP
jgi:subtilisin family serine protease